MAISHSPADSTGTTCSFIMLPICVGKVSAKLSTENFLSLAKDKKSSFSSLSAGESEKEQHNFCSVIRLWHFSGKTTTIARDVFITKTVKGVAFCLHSLFPTSICNDLF